MSIKEITEKQNQKLYNSLKSLNSFNENRFLSSIGFVLDITIKLRHNLSEI